MVRIGRFRPLVLYAGIPETHQVFIGEQPGLTSVMELNQDQVSPGNLLSGPDRAGSQGLAGIGNRAVLNNMAGTKPVAQFRGGMPFPGSVGSPVHFHVGRLVFNFAADDDSQLPFVLTGYETAFSGNQSRRLWLVHHIGTPCAFALIVTNPAHHAIRPGRASPVRQTSIFA